MAPKKSSSVFYALRRAYAAGVMGTFSKEGKDYLPFLTELAEEVELKIREAGKESIQMEKFIYGE